MRDIIIIGGVRWSDEINQPSLHAARVLSCDHRVLYLYSEVQGSVLRNLVSPREPLPVRKAIEVTFGSCRLRRVHDNLWVAPLRGLPALLPLSYPEICRRISLRTIRVFLGRARKALGFQQPVLWFYWWFFPELVEMIPHSAALYDCIDEHTDYAHNREVPALSAASQRQEIRLLRKVDIAFAVSPYLAEAKSAMAGRPVLHLPNGIDLDVVGEALADSTSPADLDALPRPLIGYTGGIGPRIDWALVANLASQHPEWTFAFVGGVAPAGLALPRNVHVLPARPYQEIIRCIRAFDLAVIPFVDDEFTRGNSFLKLFDYLLVGKPVIATPLPAVLDLLVAHPGVVTTAKSVEEWSSAISQVIENGVSAEAIAAGRRVAAEHSTRKRIATMWSHVEAAAGKASPGAPLPHEKGWNPGDSCT